MKNRHCLAAALFLWAGQVAAAPSPSAADSALQNYLAAIASANSVNDLHKHWSGRFVQENKAAGAQMAALPADTRALLESRVLQGLKQVARDGKGRFTVSCAGARCAARAPLPNGLTQTFWFVEERGSVLVDGANTHAGP